MLNEMIFRLILSACFGGVIGFERERSHRPAGLRTHILVSIGSTLVMLISVNSFNDGDPARLAAQVVSGVGFLGAGTIMRDGSEVKGLTTAASLWVSAGIGLAIGAGAYVLAATTVLIALFSLVVLNFLQHIDRGILAAEYSIICLEQEGLVEEICKIFKYHRIEVDDLYIDSMYKDQQLELKKINFRVLNLKAEDLDDLQEKIDHLDGVISTNISQN